MRSTRRFEGRSLEELLEKVRTEFGPSAAIVEANKLRSGGLGGFFAKERFEVVVEIDETPAPRHPMPQQMPQRMPIGILDLVDRVSDEEAAMPAPIAQAAGFHPAPMPAPVFTPAPMPAPAPVPAHVFAADPVAYPDPEPPRPETPFASVLRRVAADVAIELEPPPTMTAPVAAPAPAPLPAAPLPAPSAPVTPIRAAELDRIGLPAHLVPRAAAEPDVTRTLLTSLERVPLPDPLPDVPGTVLAVVGPRSEALHLARRFATDLGEDPSAVVLVSENFKGLTIPEELRLAGADAAAEHRRSWRRRRQPTFVAVDAAPGRESGAWARAVLDAMEPTSVWATVHACRKPEDVSAWAEQLGGIDALAVTHLEDTTSPAAVLQVGIPVGRLDGRPASAALWAALLTERIAA